MEAGCRRQWRPIEGSDSHYLNWLIWEYMSKEHKITAEESDAAWNAFLARHGENYPKGNWREKDLAYEASLAPNEKADLPPTGARGPRKRTARRDAGWLE
jgi:hypothetical protein